MQGKKRCHECTRIIPVAKKVCECGHIFASVKKCYKCGQYIPIAKKICECKYVFKERKSPGFKELPVILTPERLRPTRPIRMIKPSYNENDFIYSVSTTIPNQRIYIGQKMIYDNDDSDDIYDIDLNNAALESIADTDFNNSALESIADTDFNNAALESVADTDFNNAALESIAESIITSSKSQLTEKGKNKLKEKLYPKRERSKLSKYGNYSSGTKKPKVIVSDYRKDDNDCDIENASACQSNNFHHLSLEKNNEINGEYVNSKDNSTVANNVTNNLTNSSFNDDMIQKTGNEFTNGKDDRLKHLIRGEVSKAMKRKFCHSNEGETLTSIQLKQTNLPPCSDNYSISGENHNGLSNREVTVKFIKEEVDDYNWDDGKIILNPEETIKPDEGSEVFTKIFKEEVSKVNDISNENRPMAQIGSQGMKRRYIKRIHNNTFIQQIKRGVGRPRIHPIRPKKAVGRPRKHPIKVSRLKKKHALKRLNIKSDIASNDTDNENKTYTILSPIENEQLQCRSAESESKKRGRPRGCKDSKPRKIRFDYIERLIARKEDVSGLLNEEFIRTSKKNSGRCFLSPPSLMASAKKEKIKNEVLEEIELEKIERKLNKTNPFCIPECKKELYSLMLEDINRRIVSQSFQSSL